MYAEAYMLWSDLWRRVTLNGDCHELYVRLTNAYGEDDRHYHTLQHILDGHNGLDSVKHLLRDLEAAQLAFWFHNFVYDTRRKDNKEKSAQIVSDVMRGLDLPLEFGRRVVMHILATRHMILPCDPDAQIVADVDLSIFGQPTDQFVRYEDLVRQEHWHLSDAEFAQQRRGEFEVFLSKPRIYLTEHFRLQFESQARQNLQFGITLLG